MSGIVVDALSKRFYTPEPVQAVDALSFTCSPGEVFGLLGPNGAGKTTLMRMMSTAIKPTAGTARFEELLAACRELGVRFIACEMGLRLAGLGAEMLTEAPVEVAGVVTALNATPSGAQMLFI